ncbi:MAG: M6 family metalloprotease domain-containing protein, partial [Candidatus Aminicenantes bacterium]|nr:M6 family metalloprotease domain-containing protein [Candidatus Aminicenantes bacterium]
MTRTMIVKRMFLQSVNFLLIFFLASLFVHGAYLTNVPQTLRQPDGTILHCLASGDEFYNWLHDLAGYTIMADPKTGFYVYALKTAAGDLVASPYIAGRVDPMLLGLEKWVKRSPERLKARLAAFEDRRSYQIPAPKTGTINNVVIFIRFASESEFTNAITNYETNFNGSTAGTNSMYNYFREASYSVLSVNTAFYPGRTGSTVVSYQDANPRNYYSPYNESTNPTGYSTDTEKTSREHTLLVNAVNSCSAQIVAGGLNLDGDSDGRVDNICFIVSGTVDAWSDLLWPHQWFLYSQTVNIGTKRVYAYNFQLNGTSGPGPSVLVHEMGHSLGAPDFYRYTDKTITPVGYWDVMSWNLSTPQHMSAFTKFKYMTWISSIPKITTAGTYTLNPLTSSTNNCYKIDSPNSTKEYFVVEYRKKQNFDSGLPGEGLVVYRVNSNTGVVGNADGPPDELYVYRPGGTLTVDGTYNNATFSSGAGRTAINDSTDPSSFLSNGGPGTLGISNVGAVGSTISFNVGFIFMSLSKRQLNFGAIAGGGATASQSVIVGAPGSWTASSAQSWIGITPASGSGTAVTQISVNPAGLGAGTYAGTVSVADPSTSNSPQAITVALRIYNPGASAVPFGEFATPVNASYVAGAIPVTGWVLDDIETSAVEIWRDPVSPEGPSLVFIGTGIFVEGARPDVETAYPNHPFNKRAGWGYMLLTNFLPNQGNGFYNLHAVAQDREGNRILLGTKTIISQNNSSVKPFGTIDTPTQGGDASGSLFVNFGWVLTPMPKTVPKNGSTISVWVDG